MGLGRFILDLLYPPKCAFCQRILERNGRTYPVCDACEAALPWASGTATGEFFTLCVAPLYYEGKVRDSLLRYKFHDATGYADVYGTYMVPRIQTHLEGAYDLISWVPLSRKRLKERGYDQAQLLAKAVARELGCTPARTLEKQRHVPRQSSLHAPEQRRANISGAYRALDPERFAGQRVLLIDDIFTTGATLSEGARTLLDAGAAGVVCATVARRRDDTHT